MADLLSTTIAGTLNVTQGATITSNLFVSNTDIVPEITKYGRALSNLNYDHVSAWYSNTAAFDYLAGIPTLSGGDPAGLFVKPDGTQLYVIDPTNGDRVQQFKLTQAYNVASAVYEGNLSVTAGETTPSDLFFSNTGTILYVIGSTGDAIDAYDLTVAWNVLASNTLVASNGLSIAGNTASPEGMHFNSNGKFLYVIGDPAAATADNVYRYTLNTAWNVATANLSSVDVFNYSAATTSSESVSLNSNGTKMYLLDTLNLKLLQYDLPTPYLISTAVLTGESHLYAMFNESGTTGTETVPRGFFLEPTSNTAYYIGSADDVVRSTRTIPGTLVSNSLVVDGKLQAYDGMEVNRAAVFYGSCFFQSTVKISSTFYTGGSTTLAGSLLHSGTSSDIGTSTANSGYAFGNGATIANRSKDISIGTGGVVQSVTNVKIGSTSGGNTNVAITANTVYVNNIDLLPAIDSAANAVAVSQNSSSTLSAKQLNFVNTATVTIAVSDSGTGNANVAMQTTGVGLRTIWIPAQTMVPQTTNGAGTTTTQTTTNTVMVKTYDFATATQEYVQFSIRMPKSWDEGTVTYEAAWTADSGTGGVTWSLQGVALSEGDPLDTAWGSAVNVADTLTTAGDLHISPTSTAVTIAGTPLAGDVTFFRVSRVVADANDTLGVDARLIGITLFVTTDAQDDT